MRKEIWILALAIALAMGLALVAYAQQMPQTVNIYEVSSSQVPQYFSSGKIDIFLNPWALPPSTLSQLSSNPNITFVSPAPISIYDYLFNPYPSNTTFNPFAYRYVRFLMNYLVDRSGVISQVFSGNAQPMVAWPSIFAPNNYKLILPSILKYNVHYDPSFVNASIYAYFVKLNKTDPVWHGRILYINHMWYYLPPGSSAPQPVTIKFFIRNDDEFRYKMGQMFMASLQQLGFTVQPEYGSLRDALTIVYGSNPANMSWSIYTEAWSVTPEPWDTGAGDTWFATWYGNVPGWGTPGWYNYANSTINNLTYMVATGNFSSLAQFEKYSELSDLMGFQQAIRVWIVYRAVSYPVLNSVKDYLPSLMGLESFNPVGVKFAYNAAHPSVLNVGMLHVAQFPWDPIGWYYSIDSYSADVFGGFLFDPFIFYSPTSGEPLPFRGAWRTVMNVNNAAATYPVPPNAVIWNATLEKWVPVGPGNTAKDIVYLYFNGTWLGTNWQDGQPITMADMIFNYYLWFDLAQLGKDLGPSASALSDLQGIISPTTSEIVGLQFFNNGTVVVYGNYWFPDPNIVAAYYAPGLYSMVVPWQVYAAMLQDFVEGKGAFTSSEASSLNTHQIDISQAGDAAILAGILKNWTATGYVWDNGSVFNINGVSFLSTSQAVQDYQDALNFYNTYGNMFISNGPYILKQLITVTPQSATLVAWSGYPFNYNYWFNKIYVSQGITSFPPQGNFAPSVVGFSPTSIVSNQTASFTIKVQGVGNPVATIYLINPSTSSILYNATATGANGIVNVTVPATVTAMLQPGTYEVLAVVHTTVAPIPAQYEATVLVSPPPPPPTTTSPPTTSTPPPTTTSPPTTSTPPPTTTSSSLLIAVVVIIVVVIIAVGVWLALGRKKQ
ncbi:MAG: ABC transporter substrate-binding protein [Thermocladium sp.]